MRTVSNIKTMWPEKRDFELCHKDRNGDTVIIHFHTPTVLHTKGKKILVRPGGVVIFDRYHTRHFEGVGTTAFLHDWIRIQGDYTDIMQICDLSFEMPYYMNDDDYITQTMQKIEIEWMNAYPYSEHIVALMLEEFFFRIARENKMPGKQTKTSNEMESKLLQLRSSMHQNYNEEWDIRKMAAYLPVSPAYLYILYKQFFGVTPKKDLQNIRIEHAKQLLRQGSLSVKEIAGQIGYENEYYFIRKFKEQTGMTPGKYKKGLGV